MFVSKSKYDALLNAYKSAQNEITELTEIIVDLDEHIEKLEKKTAKKTVAKKATKKASK